MGALDGEGGADGDAEVPDSLQVQVLAGQKDGTELQLELHQAEFAPEQMYV